MNAIELNAVNYQHKEFKLNDISFEVPQGFVTGFIGANGVGKTTLIRLIMDLIEINSIEIVKDLIVAVSYTHLTLPTNTVTCRSRWSPYH